MEIKKEATKEEIKKAAIKFINGIDSHNWYTRHYIVIVDWTEHDLGENKHRYMGAELKCIPYDYSGSDYRFIAEVETNSTNRYSDGNCNYFSKQDIVNMIISALNEEFNSYFEYCGRKEEK